MTDENEDAWWHATSRLASGVLASALVLVLVFSVALMTLDEGEFFGFPPGYFLVALVLPVLLTALLFWFCRRQAGVDRRYGLSED